MGSFKPRTSSSGVLFAFKFCKSSACKSQLLLWQSTLASSYSKKPDQIIHKWHHYLLTPKVCFQQKSITSIDCSFLNTFLKTALFRYCCPSMFTSYDKATEVFPIKPAEGVQTFSEHDAFSWKQRREANGAIYLRGVGDKVPVFCFQQAQIVLLPFLLPSLHHRIRESYMHSTEIQR